MHYALCAMYYALSTMYYALCTMYYKHYVLCTIPALGWVQVCHGAKDDQNNLQNTLLNFLLLIATFEMEVYKQKFVIAD